VTNASPAPPKGETQRNLVLGLIAIAGLLIWADAGRRIDLGELVALAIGGGVGWAELLARYRTAPLRATLTTSALAYVAVNVGAAATAYWLIPIFDDELGKSATQKAAIERVLLASFGSLAFLRSSLFKWSVAGADVNIGPAALLDTLLLVADRGVDRREAISRAQDVSALVRRVRQPRLIAVMLTQYCLALMQNVDKTTQTEIAEAVDKILARKETPDAILLDLVALQLSKTVGADVLAAAVEALGDRLDARAARDPSLHPGAGAMGGPSAAPDTTAAVSPLDASRISKAALEAELRAAAAEPTSPPHAQEPSN
jgi:hypothetical protein